METPQAEPSPELRRWLLAAGECRSLADRLVEQAARQSRKVSSRAEELQQLIMWMLTPKACDTFDALVVLCRSGWGVEAGVLFRVLMETAATAVLVNRFPEPFLFLYVESMAKGFRDDLLALRCIERRDGGL